MKRYRLSIVVGVVISLAASFCMIGSASAVTPIVQPAGYTVGGVDVSSWQGPTIDWATVAVSDRFMYAKATEGSTYVNPSFVAQYTGAKAAGLFTGAYAFARPDSAALGQADFFLDNSRFAADGKTLPPMLDLEWPYTSGSGYVAPYPCYGLTPADMVTWIRTFVNEVKRRTGSQTLIYTNPNWWNPCTGSTTSFGDELLDESSFTATPPTTLASSWTSWTIWQYASQGSLPGDQNVYAGTPDQLTALAASTGCKHIPSDFNGDGYADVAIGEPRATVSGDAGAGAVRIGYGSADGLSATGAQYFDQASDGFVGDPAVNAGLGTAVVSGYFNNDCYADLAIGAPGTTNGSVVILYGSPDGLSTAGSVLINGYSKASRYGSALATGDVNGDGHPDLIVGAPNGLVGTAVAAGQINVRWGTAAGLSGSAWITEATSGIPGTQASYDHFGASVAVADFTGDHVADIAVGEPGKAVGSARSAGSVVIVKGAHSTTLGAGAQLWSAATTGVPGAATAGNYFGASLAAGDVTGDGRADLAVGTLYVLVGSTTHAGDVTLLRGTSTGLTATGSQLLYQSTTGAAPRQAGGEYGSTLAMGDVNGDGHADLAIGTPYEDIGAVKDAGSVAVLFGASAGLTSVGAQVWTPGAGGVPGEAAASGLFGSGLYAGPIANGYASLVVGASHAGTTTEGTITVFAGSAAGGTLTGGQFFGESDMAASAPGNSGPATLDSFGASIG